MEAETDAYIQRMMVLKEQLQEQATKFELIEQEKDKKQRKLKQKEYVFITHTDTHHIHIMCVYLLCYVMREYVIYIKVMKLFGTIVL